MSKCDVITLPILIAMGPRLVSIVLKFHWNCGWVVKLKFLLDILGVVKCDLLRAKGVMEWIVNEIGRAIT